MEFKTKNYKFWLKISHCWYDWAFPLRIDIDLWHKDYTDVLVQILFFWIDFTKASHKFLDSASDLFDEGDNND